MRGGAAGRGRTLTDEVRDLEALLLGLGYPQPEQEYRFAPPRRFRADWAYPARKLLIEFEGGTFVGGRHTSGTGYESDCRKYNLAALHDYRVLRFTVDMVRDGTALDMIRRALDDD